MKFLASLMIAVMMSVLSGCGGTDFGPLGQIEGTVTAKGKPISPNSQLVFMQMDKGFAGYAYTEDNGHYTIEWIRDSKKMGGLPVGTYKVMIQPPVGVDTESMTADEMLAGVKEKKAVLEFDKKYQNTTTSGLEFTIQEGPNTVNIELP